MTHRVINSMNSQIHEPVTHFKDILLSVIENLKINNYKVKKLSKTDEANLNQYIKNQKDCKFIERSSNFLDSSLLKIKERLNFKLKKQYLIIEDEDEEKDYDEFEDFLEKDSPKWLYDITSNNFRKDNPEAFLNNSNLWLTRYQIDLFGDDEKFWILIVGVSESLDSGPKFSKNRKKLIRSKKENCYYWWESYISKNYFENDIKKMYEKLGILVCSERFAKNLFNEFPKSLLYSTGHSIKELTELFSDLHFK
jgi:hypothetical protein